MSSDAHRPGGDPRTDRRGPTAEPTTAPPTNPRPTNPAETNEMSTHDSGPTDPTADPTAAPRTDPTTNPSFDPTADPTVTASDTAADPAATTQIPSTSTQALPAHSPFRVEPSTPVPDDVVTPGSELPHLPPPAASQPAPAPQLPPRPVRQPAPRPTIVTVRKGPRPATVMLGLLTVLVAAFLLVANGTHASLGLRATGPAFVGAFGGILLLVGLAGVVAGRLRRR